MDKFCTYQKISSRKPLNETIELIPNYETHDVLMKCTDCLHKTLGPDQSSADLKWDTLKPGNRTK